ncbi:MAG: hypothetical protein ACO3S0_09265, partial [bacterium]
MEKFEPQLLVNNLLPHQYKNQICVEIDLCPSMDSGGAHCLELLLDHQLAVFHVHVDLERKLFLFETNVIENLDTGSLIEARIQNKESCE